MKFEAVLFDCDGVLVDSEGISGEVLRDMLEELGWSMTRAECIALFVGKTMKDEVPMIVRKTGHDIGEDWLVEFRSRRNVALTERLQPIANAPQAVAEIHMKFQGRIACASGADMKKVELQLHKVGLIGLFEGRLFSGYELARSKPAPDVYLAAAAALGVDIARCAVIEDSVTGVTSGVSAGATVFGYSPGGLGHSGAQALLDAGASVIFADMAALPGLLEMQTR